MISEALARRIAEEAFAASTADETLVLLTGGKSALTRFANNGIHQNVLQKDYSVTVLTAFGQRVGMASSNLFDRSELERIVDLASAVALRQKEDPLWTPLSGAQSYETVEDVYDQATIEADPGDKAERVRQLIAPSLEAGYKAFGALTNGDSVVAVATSHGLFSYHCHTSANLTLTVETPSGASGWSEACSNRLDEIDLPTLASRALEKARLAENPVSLAPGRYAAILESPAVSTMLRYMAMAGLGGMSFNEGRSFLSGKIGEQVMGKNVTLRDDYLSGAMRGLPFDFEGVPRQRLTLIEKGVARAVVHSRRTAHGAGVENTGHALPYPSSMGPLPLNLILEGGSTSQAEQLAGLKKGILLTRSWYESLVDPKKPTLTGMSRDGTYLVEDGQIVGAIKNLRYNEDLRDLLCRVENLSREQETSGEWGLSVTAPALHVRDFHVTGSTT